MTRTPARRAGRAIAVGAAAAALLAGAATSATATAHTPAHTHTTATVRAATNNLQVTPIRTQVGKNLTYTGSTTGITPGTTVQLQQLIGSTWQDVAGKTTKTKNDLTYGPIYDPFRTTGEKTMRTNTGGVLSNEVHITITN
ncbi:hypothetical protein [Actinacidiphila sp. ITFR-21]|uniref:hypothetical protein n=1 Tax=Actinacidiphila sp. ITFR-21 TaxID=3075199 RepID=UPI00288B5CBF|nr:hypothetical protein [Streptomyces sp. ITFR-21]WNI14096.1 hypothetical protein RLT57_00175 [Streptomyces sp. ITFR-21]